MRLPTQDEANAFVRHIVTFGCGGVTMFAALHLITGGDSQAATTALNQIGHGLSEIITGAGTLIAIGSGVMAALSASPLLQLLKGANAVANNPALAKQVPVQTQAAVAAAAVEMPKIDTVVAAPEVANAVPSPNVKASS